MGVIEVLTFRLAPGVDEVEFLNADQRAQTEFLYYQPGMLRRTTARAVGDDWLVVTLWGSTHDADASAEAGRDDATISRWSSFVERSSVTTKRYDTLE
jgi:hypothetical protein